MKEQMDIDNKQVGHTTRYRNDMMRTILIDNKDTCLVYLCALDPSHPMILVKITV